MGIIGKDYPLSIKLAQLAVFTTLFGRGVLYLIWDAPLRTLLWDESLMSSIVGVLGWTWSDWATDAYVEESIGVAGNCLGLVLVLLSIGALLAHKYRSLAVVTLPLATLLCLFHVILSTKAHFGQVGHFIELSLQWFSPILLLLLLRKNQFTTAVDYAFRITIALTFIGHGLYAIGYYPVPGNFQDMMMNGFGVNKKVALFLLKTAGLLDFVAATLLLLPVKKWATRGLYYIIIWGGLTAIARVWSYWGLVDATGLFYQWIPETLVRFTHFLIPLALFLWQKKLPLRYSKRYNNE